jgi:hypothetical protein
MKIKDYLQHCIFHTGNKKPTSLRAKSRVVYRTAYKIAGITFISKVHLGIEAEKIVWSDSAFFSVYDYAEVTPNVLIEQAKTVKI